MPNPEVCDCLCPTHTHSQHADKVWTIGQSTAPTLPVQPHIHKQRVIKIPHPCFSPHVCACVCVVVLIEIPLQKTGCYSLERSKHNKHISTHIEDIGLFPAQGVFFLFSKNCLVRGLK